MGDGPRPVSGQPGPRRPREGAVYIISVAAELAGVHPQTLRTYERKGLIRPARTSGGTRRYSDRDVERVRLIQELTQGDGVNLAGVMRILDLQDRLEAAEAAAAQARAATQRARRDAEEALADALRRTSAEIVLYRPSAVERHRGRRRRR
ncbi:MAG TPA: helix-turn-helix transcriptional regulator [Egibacteraceae bacterium]|nr:helix-turn-helix transcriptional regulator [Egibacteraceae bacterium]